jgi:CHAD domain-containing protein
MRDAVILLLDQAWKEFSDVWRKAREESSEKSVHNLRVSARRLIATLELIQGVSRQKEIPELNRTIKKVLSRMGRLRDVQVQLEKTARFQHRDCILSFNRTLERLERREIEKIHNHLKSGRRERLAIGMKKVRSEFCRKNRAVEHHRIARVGERLVAARSNAFLKARRQFQLQQLNNDALHEMRIALKKLRYLLEALPAVLRSPQKLGTSKLRAFQKLMGESRDLEMLRIRLETWAREKGKFIAVVPVLEHLQERREILLTKIIAVSDELEEKLTADIDRPVAETTQAIVLHPDVTIGPNSYAAPS